MKSSRPWILVLLILLMPHAAAAQDMAAGLQRALILGSERAVEALGQPGGFWNDPQARIPLPGPLQSAQSGLRMVGASGMLDDLHLRMNRAAEQAVPVAQALVVDAIQELSFADAAGIVRGADDAATQYLQRETAEPLAGEMRPIVDDALADAGVVTVYNDVVDQVSTLPFASAVDVDLTGHVVRAAQDALFAVIAEEERAIRRDPAGAGSDLLTRVFGG